LQKQDQEYEREDTYEAQDFELLRDLVREKGGIYFQSSKRQYFTRRLRKRMEILGYRKLHEYYNFLVADTSNQEVSELLNVLTTTETYFFRNAQQLQSFEKEVIPTLLKQKREAGVSHIHVWSAGCSSGEEPYTLAMLLLENIPDIQQWRISIAATDVNTEVLEKAREGRYSSRSLRDTPRHYKTKYFTKDRDFYRIHDHVKKMVSFRTSNLIVPQDTALIQNVDCIFCRNVLIYFDVETCRNVVDMFYEKMARNGYLFLGHSESLYRITTIFKLLKLQHSLVYYKE
jgi:chemotaxis protein methyltransferase CheR